MEYEINTNGGVEFDGVGAEGGGIEGDPYWGNGPNDAIWATEEDYEIASAQGYNRGSDGAWGGGLEYTRGRHGEPPSKKSKGGSHSDSARNRNGGYQAELGQGGSSGTPPPPLNSNAREGSSSGGSSSGRGKGTGRMFFKTKLCCKFRQGICPFSSNCNFAHGMEELRKPPPNWQEIVAQQEERERRADNQIPCVVSTSDGAGEMQRYHKTRLCKKFYTEEGCPYGERCNFVHDDQWRSRESVTISLGPTPTAGNGSAAVNGNNAANGSFQRPSNWKTRICNKWETTGHCPFGEKCHFAHGLAELQKYGGGLPDAEAIDASASLRNDAKQNGSASKAHVEAVAGQASSFFNSENYVIGSSARTIGNILSQRSGQRIMPKWKGPDKISRIYGDWIEDNEWEFLSKPALQQFDIANNGDEEVLNEV